MPDRPHLTARQVFSPPARASRRHFPPHVADHVRVLAPDNPIGTLSGPSFAYEVAAGHAHCHHPRRRRPARRHLLQHEFSSAALRPYTNEDVIGVELGGALKNVIALAAGVVTGLDLGNNAAAALITRGIAEITRLAMACGGRRETMSGLSGIGDLVLTCTGSLSATAP